EVPENCGKRRTLAEGRPRSGYRRADAEQREGCGRSAVRRPLNWPRYMVERRLKGGAIAYYWTPRRKDLKAGFTIAGEALGTDYAAALARAEGLNGHLDAWRTGKGGTKEPDDGSRYGSVKWLFARYLGSAAFERVSERTRPVYLRALRQLEEL